MRTAIYPGTFDPFTFGHNDILIRANKIFDKLIVGVAHSINKEPLFGLEERIQLISENIDKTSNIEIKVLDGLLVDFAKDNKAQAIVRGLRAISDFEFEFEMTQMNRNLDPELETIFFMPKQDYIFISSRLIKQVAQYSTEKISKYVPDNVANALKKRFGQTTN